MKPVTEYRLEWDTMPVQTIAGEVIPTQTIRVSIFDNDNLIPDDQITEVIPLVPTGDPLTISIINNDEDKYSPIRGKQAVIRFLSDGSQFQEMATFSDSSDNRWYVEIKDITNTITIFVGFLMLSDMQQLFQPDPVTVELTASDHLGLLRDIPLTDFNEDTPMGKYTFAALISYCLRKTGLSLYWTAINNLRHGSGERIATNVNFNATGNVITVDFFIGFFYVGMPLQIDSASNDMTTTVTEIISSTQIRVADTLVNETATIYNVTFTDTSSTNHFYLLYLDTKTFEDEIGTCINCYEVLEAMLTVWGCFLVQHLNKWWIVSVNEYDSNLMYPAEFDPDGTFIEFGAAIDLSKSIGDADTIRFCNADQLLRSSRPHKSYKETYKYEYPLEIVCNQDFSRGDFIETLPSETNEDGVLQTVKSYEVDCWEFLSRQGGGVANQIGYYDQAPIADSDAYVKKFFYNDAEIKKELVIETPAASGTGVPYIKSQPIPVNIKDKINFSVSLFYSNIGGTTGYVDSPVMIGLFADSGNVYWWKAGDILNPNDPQQWILTAPAGIIPDWYLGASIEEPPNTLSFESPAIPETGNLVIYLINWYASNIKAHYSALNLDIIAFINGSYQKYTGHYDKVTTVLPGYNAIRETEVKISDSPRKLFKGSMFILVDGVYQLTSQFYIAIPGDSRAPNRYGYLQSFSVWNQYRTAFRILSGSVLGLGDDPPDIIHKYTLSDSNLNTTGKLFILISYNQNWKAGIWTAVFLEVFDINNPKIYSDIHEFRFIIK